MTIVTMVAIVLYLIMIAGLFIYLGIILHRNNRDFKEAQKLLDDIYERQCH